MGEALKQIQEFASGLSTKQKMVIALGTLLVAGTVWLFVRVLAAPDQKTLYSGLSAEDARNIGTKLAAKNIPYEMGADGMSIQVAADQLDRARMETASGGLPSNARMGFEIFDTPNWMGTDFTDKVNYQRALEGELERTIQTLSEVEAARVHLVFPSESLFREREREGKAAVIVKTRQRLSLEKQFAIAQLVSSAVDKLRPENVTVVDSETGKPMPGLEEGASSGGLGEQLSKQLTATLAPVVGEGRVRATVRVEYDSSSLEDTQETYDPKSAVAVNLQRSEEMSGSGAIGGIPGTASNMPNQSSPAVAVKDNGDHISAKSEAGTYVVNKSLRHTIQPAGRVRRITAAVIVDDAPEIAAEGKTATSRKRTPEEMKELEQLAGAAIGLDQSRGDVLAVENLAFHQGPAEKLLPPTRLERVRVGMKNWSGVLRIAAILLLFVAVYLAILRPVKRQILTAFRDLPGRLAGKANPEIVREGEVIEKLNESPIGSLKKQLAEKVKAEPVEATKLVQSWIRETAR